MTEDWRLDHETIWCDPDGHPLIHEQDIYGEFRFFTNVDGTPAPTSMGEKIEVLHRMAFAFGLEITAIGPIQMFNAGDRVRVGDNGEPFTILGGPWPILEGQPETEYAIRRADGTLSLRANFNLTPVEDE